MTQSALAASQAIIFTDEVDVKGGWHGAQLAKAFANRGLEAVFINLQTCLIDITGSKPRIEIPGLSQANLLPKAVFIRGIAGGTMQQITTRLNVLHILHMQGVKVYNQARAIERTVDKGMTSFLLAQVGIATPQTWVCESRQLAHQIIETQTKQTKLVLKPLFGSQGRGLRLIDASSQYPLPMDALVDGVFYLQKFIDAAEKNHDFRVFIIRHQAVATMRRNGEGWLNNVAQGAHCEYVVDDEVANLAVQASRAIDISYCGVDIMRDKQGKLWVIEVNSIPAWYGLQSVTPQNIAQFLVDDFLIE